MIDKQALFDEVEKLVKCAVSAPSKDMAKLYLDQLKTLCSTSGLMGYTNNVFHDLVCSTDRASGRVSEKERLKGYAMQDLYKFESLLLRSTESEGRVDG